MRKHRMECSHRVGINLAWAGPVPSTVLAAVAQRYQVKVIGKSGRVQSYCGRFMSVDQAISGKRVCRNCERIAKARGD